MLMKSNTNKRDTEAFERLSQPKEINSDKKDQNVFNRLSKSKVTNQEKKDGNDVFNRL